MTTSFFSFLTLEMFRQSFSRCDSSSMLHRTLSRLANQGDFNLIQLKPFEMLSIFNAEIGSMCKEILKGSESFLAT